MTGLAAALVAVLAILVAGPGSAAAAPRHAIAMHGAPKYGPDISHFPYVNPDAPKGGIVTYGALGTFDSLNPFIVKGTTARGLRDDSFGNNVYESLLQRGYDEPFTLYGLIAETVETPDDRSWVEFRLRPEAKFSDGDPIEADDVIHSFELLRDKGRPNYRTYYAKVSRVSAPDARTVRFEFAGEAPDRELPLILGLMPIFPKHRMSAEAFEQTSLVPPIGSGPYLVATLEAGARLVLKRNPDYWGRNLAVKRGFDNYDEIRIEYYRNQTGLFEAFKKGLVDILPETDPGRWSQAYDFPAVRDRRVIKDEIPTGLPRGMSGFVFNTRRPIFSDARVRDALGRVFDAEWVNKNLYFGLYRRADSYFSGSELAAAGRAASPWERRFLAQFPDAVRPDISEGTWRPPTTDGSGRDRAQLKSAFDLLASAGWSLSAGAMTETATGRPLAFEILVNSPENERLALVYQRALKLLGIEASVRNVDAAQYQRRLNEFDFDMIVASWPASLSPGNEQLFRWSSASATTPGSFNYPGVRSPAADAAIAALLQAEDRATFVDAVRALDRILLSGFYVVPLFHLPDQWVARWARIERPETTPLWGAVPATWWARPKANGPS